MRARTVFDRAYLTEWDQATPNMIDAGIDMSGGFMITRAEFKALSREEWHRLDNWANSMANVVVDEDRERDILTVYSATPCITSLAS